MQKAEFDFAFAPDKKAQLWIDHDKPQSQAQKRSPQFYD